MLPGVNAQQRDVLADNGVLVLEWDQQQSLIFHCSQSVTYSVAANANLASLLVLDEPSPSAALDAGQGGVHLVLELAEAAVGVVDGLSQGTRRGLTTTSALGSQVLPEEGVVQVTTTVEVDGGLEGNLGRDVTLGLGILQLLHGVVVVGDVGFVVVVVVQLHDLAGDRGLQGTIVVWFAMSVDSLHVLSRARQLRAR